MLVGCQCNPGATASRAGRHARPARGGAPEGGKHCGSVGSLPHSGGGWFFTFPAQQAREGGIPGSERVRSAARCMLHRRRCQFLLARHGTSAARQPPLSSARTRPRQALLQICAHFDAQGGGGVARPGEAGVRAEGALCGFDRWCEAGGRGGCFGRVEEEWASTRVRQRGAIEPAQLQARVCAAAASSQGRPREPWALGRRGRAQACKRPHPSILGGLVVHNLGGLPVGRLVVLRRRARARRAVAQELISSSRDGDLQPATDVLARGRRETP